MTEGSTLPDLIHASPINPQLVVGSQCGFNSMCNMDSVLPFGVIDLELECRCHEYSKIGSRSGVLPLSTGHCDGVRGGSDHHL
jgi:hypothetical protein